MRCFITISLFSFAFLTNVNAQTYFNKLYDYDNSNIFLNCATTSYKYASGDFLLGTTKFYSSSFGALHFIKINSSGDTIFSKRYPKPYCAYSTAIGNSLIKCFDGNLVLAGAFYDSAGTYPNALLVKLNEDGDTLWTKNYGGSNFDNANVVCQTIDSGFVLMGVTQSFSMGSASDFYLIKTDKNGTFQWQQVYGTTLPEDCVSGQITLDGGFILAGHRNNQLHIVKTDSAGNFKWEKVYSGTAGQGFIKQLQDSTYILVGTKLIAGLSYQAYMAKLTKTGVIIWENTYGGSGDQQFYTVPIILNDGSIVCSGVSTIGIPWGLLIKTDSLGNQQWLRTYYANPSNDNYIYDLKLTNDNGFIMTGSGNVTGQDAWVVKVDSAGCEIANCNVGVEEFEAQIDHLKVYPNPSSEYTKIEIHLNEEVLNAQLIVYNLLGMEVTKRNVVNGDSFTINTEVYNNGIYFYVLLTEAGVIEKEIIIISK